jgi:hypothetical protein
VSKEEGNGVETEKKEKENVIYLTFKSQRWKEENLSCCFVVTLWCYSVIGNGIFPLRKKHWS